MQDKRNIENVVLVIMGLVEDYHEYGHTSYKDAIESKLRELMENSLFVRDPLSDGVIKMIDDSTHFHESVDWPIRFARAIESAHGITNTSGLSDET